MVSGFHSLFSKLLRSWKWVAGFLGAVVLILTVILQGRDLYEWLFDGSLELVDVGYTTAEVEPSKLFKKEGYKAWESPTLDFKLANTSEDPIVIKRADIRVKRVWTFRPPYHFDPTCGGALPLTPTFNYDVELPTRSAPYTIRKNLSQSIEPGKNDRFTLSLHYDKHSFYERTDSVLLLEITLIYGENEDVLPAQNVLYGEVKPFAGATYSYQHSDECWPPKKGLDKSDVDRLTRHNEQAVSEIKQIEAPRNAGLKTLLRTVSGQRSYNLSESVNPPPRKSHGKTTP